MRGTTEQSGGPEIWVRGPVIMESTPEAMNGPAEPSEPVLHQQCAWLSVHGGAGASTLATLLGGVDIGHRWPDVSRGEPHTVLLVARTHSAGLQAVSQTLDVFRRGDQPPGVQVAAVVLVADAPGRLPRALNQRIKIIGSAIAVHRVPWVAAWRTGELNGPVPREVTALAHLVTPPSH
ncbi:DUF6668 family protein [Streptomyces sp. NPDC021098]|uniref:DUF6668 family protein n=1 Tax=unclassified Streptomyces TaxID=2593676 RepID=UPI003793E0C2